MDDTPTELPPLPSGSGRAFGTFGELLQGVLDDGRDFLVTLPIREWSTARFWLSPESDTVRVEPAHKVKSARLARHMLRVFGGRGGVLELTSTLAEGKGLASSSADLVATARAVADALGVILDERLIEDFLRLIEPSDGVMYDGIVSFHHREVQLREHLGCLPGLTIIAHDEGGQVDTVAFNREPKRYTEADRREYTHLLSGLSEAIRKHDLDTVGAISTRSTEIDELRRPRPHLGQIRLIGKEIEGLGLVLGHSGTVAGILVADDDPDRDEKVEFALRAGRKLAGSMSVYRSLCPAGPCAAPEPETR